MKLKKLSLVVLALALAIGMLSGCSVGNKKADDGKIHIKIGGTPVERTEGNAAVYDLFQERAQKFMEENPDIVVEADTFSFDLKNYLTKAAAGDLPTMFYTSPTELKLMADSGYIKDISEQAKKYGFYDGYDLEKYKELFTVDGKMYAVAYGTPSHIGVMYNKKVMKEAGLVDANGAIKYPQTWEELAVTAQTIKEKTGKTGFFMPTKNNQGGWLSLNVFWAFGTEFMKQENNKWVATFASDEGVAALEYFKDLKWKYNAIQADVIADINGSGKALAANEVGMTINGIGITNNFVQNYELDIKNIAMSRIPAGPKGRVSQRNASVYVFTGTDEENDACFKWLEFIGQGAKVTDDMKEQWNRDYKIKHEKGYAVGYGVTDLWVDEERIKAEEEIQQKYRTVDESSFADYMSSDGITYRSEPERCAQQLYSAIDACLQQVFSDENADCRAILEKAQKDFQLNYLDKETN